MLPKTLKLFLLLVSSCACSSVSGKFGSLLAWLVGWSRRWVHGCLVQLEKNGKLSPTSPPAATPAKETAVNERNRATRREIMLILVGNNSPHKPPMRHSCRHLIGRLLQRGLKRMIRDLFGNFDGKSNPSSASRSTDTWAER